MNNLRYDLTVFLPSFLKINGVRQTLDRFVIFFLKIKKKLIKCNKVQCFSELVWLMIRWHHYPQYLWWHQKYWWGLCTSTVHQQAQLKALFTYTLTSIEIGAVYRYINQHIRKLWISSTCKIHSQDINRNGLGITVHQQARVEALSPQDIYFAFWSYQRSFENTILPLSFFDSGILTLSFDIIYRYVSIVCF